MPLPQTFERATLTVNGRRYDLVNVRLTDQSFEQEFSDVRGYGPSVVARTHGRLTERVTLEGELIELPLTNVVARAVADRIPTTHQIHDLAEALSTLESDADFRARIARRISAPRNQETVQEASGSFLDAYAAQFGMSRFEATKVVLKQEPTKSALKDETPTKSALDWILEDDDLAACA